MAEEYFQATAVILAGGNSERMGQDKSFLDWNGQPIIAHVLNQLRPYFRRVVVSGPREKFSFLGCPVVEDRLDNCGPLGGIEAALAEEFDEWLFFTACDIPHQSVELIATLYQQRSGAQCVVPCTHGIRNPLFGFYHCSVGKHLVELVGQHSYSIQRLLDLAQTKVVQAPAESAADLDTPEEYKNMRPGAGLTDS